MIDAGEQAWNDMTNSEIKRELDRTVRSGIDQLFKTKLDAYRVANAGSPDAEKENLVVVGYGFEDHEDRDAFCNRLLDEGVPPKAVSGIGDMRLVNDRYQAVVVLPENSPFFQIAADICADLRTKGEDIDVESRTESELDEIGDDEPPTGGAAEVGKVSTMEELQEMTAVAQAIAGNAAPGLGLDENLDHKAR